jgi:predicted hotdog family 3-hydroxylacyl-ACP dehydratase
MLNRDEILALIPHQGDMCLWDRVDAWDATHIRLATASHLCADNPLRAEGMLRAVHLCEYGAQAMAVHGGVLARASAGAAKAGMLVSLRGVSLYVARVDDVEGDLVCEAELLAAGAGSQQYAFRIHCGERVLAEGRAAVILQG